MKTLSLAILAAVAASSVAAAQPASSVAAAQPASLKQCFSPRQIDNSVVPDDSTINFKVGSRVYQAKMNAPCPRLKDSWAGFTLLFQGSTQICSALDLRLTVNDIGGTSCIAKSLRQLTPAEVQALPAKQRP